MKSSYSPNGLHGDKVTNSAEGVDIATLARAKGLSPDTLRQWGVSDSRYQGVRRVVIPYLSSDGETLATRYRLSINHGQRFRWKLGAKVHLYGLSKLEAIRKAGWVLLVEGETDTWTAWLYGIPALGIPGKSTWQAEWAQYLDSLDVFIWCEPEAEDLVLRVSQDIPVVQVIYAPAGIKDLNEAHVRGLDPPMLIEGLKAKAILAEQVRREITDKEVGELRRRAAPILGSPDPLKVIQRAISASGYGGDNKLPFIIYIAMTSRVLHLRDGGMLVHLLLLGPTSAGKSYTVLVCLRLLPEATYVLIDAGSPRTLIYDSADLKHKVLIYGEADSLLSGEDNPAASAMRNLLQDGHLHYDVTVRDDETGEWTVRKVRKQGPTVLVTTAVEALRAQLMSRLFTLDVSGDARQVKAALETQALVGLEGPPQEADDALIAFQEYLQVLAPWPVVVPFVKELADAIGKGNNSPRVLRDFQRLLSMIKAVAVIRHRLRATDIQGRLVADIADYEFIYNLVGEMYTASVTGITQGMTDVVTKVRELLASDTVVKITYSVLSKELRVHRDLVKRRVGTAIHNGWLVNRETRKNYQADIVSGDPLPDKQGLPTPDELCHLVTPFTDGGGPLFDNAWEEV